MGFIDGYSLLRVMACAAVVLLHTCHTCVAMDLLTPAGTAAANAIKANMIWAVPCFVMVTGALLLDPGRELTLKRLFRRYVLRVAAVIVVFTVLFAVSDGVFRYVAETAGTASPSAAEDGMKAGAGAAVSALALIGESLAQVPFKIWTDGSWSHMWYLYTLLGLYLLMPAFRKISAGSDRNEMRYLIGVGVIFLMVLPTVDTIAGTSTGFRICVTSVYPLFLFTGYACAAGYLRPGRAAAAAMAVLAAVLVTAMSLAQSRSGNQVLKSLLAGYTFPAVWLQGFGIFRLVTAARLREGLLRRAVLTADRCSFGIYLIHLLPLRIILTAAGSGAKSLQLTVPMMLLLAAAVFLISYAAAALLKKLLRGALI